MDWTAEDVITTDRYLAAFPEDYHKTDVFVVGPVWWRGKIVEAPKWPCNRIVAGHSDYPVTSEIIQKHPAHWYSVNMVAPEGQGIPLGITNDCSDGPIHRVLGNIPMMVEVAQQPRQIQNFAYMNFSPTHPCREPIWRYFRTLPWVTTVQTSFTMEDRRKYLQSLRNHVFALCPRGNGVDTHRLWEALYMGCIPIVERDPAHRNWEDLPICWINHWGEVTIEFLLKEKARIEAMNWPREKLRVSYWIDFIQRTSK